MSDLHLLDVTVLPGSYVNDVIEGTWTNLITGIEKAEGKVIYGFKVVGENRLIAITDGSVEAAMGHVTSAYGEQTKVTCTPLRAYEHFAERVLGLKKSTVTPAKKKLRHDGRHFWLHFTIEYSGMKTADLMAIWAREATAALMMRSEGNVELELYKVVAQREMHLLVSLRNGDVMDDVSFTLPIMSEHGNQTKITCKSIASLLPPTT